MILPTKHITLNNSLLGVGAVIIDLLDTPHTVSGLWEKARMIPELRTFERYSITLSFLYIIGAIELNQGLLRRCPHDT